MAAHGRWLVIVNPVSNRGAAQKTVPALQRQLDHAGIYYDLVHTERPGHAVRLAFVHASDYSVMLAVGGDGTVHEMINGLVQYTVEKNPEFQSPTLGVIPIGSGNDYAKILSIPPDPAEAAKIILRGENRPMDIGEIIIDEKEKIYFHNNIGIGFDAYVNQRKNHVRWFRGSAAYLSAVIQSVFLYRHSFMKISWQQQSLNQKTLLTHIGIGRVSGGGFYLTPEAIPDDGVFDVCVIHSIGKLKMLKELPKALIGTHIYLKEVKIFRTPALVIESEVGIPVHADGEMIAQNARKIECRIIAHRIPFFYHNGN